MSEPEIRDYRYERKFLVRDLDAAQVRLLVSLHPGMFRQPYPPRYINNLYLDTEAMSNYAANLDGASERAKMRIRWYGELQGEVASPMLEIKIKSGLVGSKHVYPFPSFRLDGAFDHSAYLGLLKKADIPENVRRILSEMDVVLCNRYHRWYYASRDGRYRITVDSNQEYYHMGRMSASLHHCFKDDRSVILELKYAKPHELSADRVSGFFPFSLSKNSKYITGIERVYL